MYRKVLAFLIILTLLCGALYAAPSLLAESVLSATYEELVAMSRAYGLDVMPGENELRQNLLEFFGLEDEAAAEQAEPVSKGTSADSIEIVGADSLVNSGRVVILSGNVEMSFSVEGGSKRSFNADRVVVDLERRILEASGSVSLSGGDPDGRVFSGEVIRLDWDNLNVIVYDGISTTTRNNSDGTRILFYAKGDSVAYNGDTSGIFFRNGTIATTLDDPYWSIEASKLSLTENDMFVDRAVFRLGRVPVFYFPIFFYPGTTLAFNPAMGYSSEKGAFLNTTVEIYGSYPGLGVTGSKNASDDTDYAASISSFLSVEQEGEQIRDGWYYRSVEEGEDLGSLETWARGTGSYLAVFADAYEELGLVLGFDTKNSFLDNRFTFTATGAAGYTPVKTDARLRNFRYSFNLDASYRIENLRLSVKLPFLSDPFARYDFLNRNTAFTLDSVLGSEQYFPRTNSATLNSYTWSVDAAYSLKAGSYSFNLNSLKADIDFKLVLGDDGIYKPSVVEASLPYVSFSSNGTFVDLKGQKVERTRTLSYTDQLAQDFADELAELQASEDVTEEQKSSSDLKAYSGPDLVLEEKTVSEAASFKSGYTFSQSLDNRYSEELEHDSFYTRVDGSVYVQGSAPGQWLSVTETIRPRFNFSTDNLSGINGKQIDEFYLTSVLKATVPKIGLTYNLSQTIYSHYSIRSTSKNERTDRWGNWDRKDVTVHNASLSHKFGYTTLGFYVQLKPLDEILRPSASYSRNGLTVSADFSFKRPSGSAEFKKDVGNLNISYTAAVFTFSLANKYDFSKAEPDAWEGYTLTQKLTVKPLTGLTINENASFKGRFRGQKLSAGATYTVDADLFAISASATMSFKGETYDRDALNLGLKLRQDKVVFWKGRIGFDSSLNLAFNYDFQNPYRTAFTVSWTFDFAVAEFLDLSIAVSSANKSFVRYYDGDGFSFSRMWQDLLKSFDFFGDGRRSTGFNLSSVSVKAVHHMRDWDLNIDVTGGLTTKYSQKYEWATAVTVFIKWTAIPELKQQTSWDSINKEWN